MAEDTPEVVESVLGEEDLASFQEEFAIPMSVGLEVLGLSKRMTIRSVTSVALHEDALKARL